MSHILCTKSESVATSILHGRIGCVAWRSDGVEAGPPVVTLLTGELPDQSALQGIMNTLFELHLPILSTECISGVGMSSRGRLRMSRRDSFLASVLAVSIVCGVTGGVLAQDDASDPQIQALEWRHIGPFNGGRGTTVVGHPTDPFVFYFGHGSGGLWKTEDAGRYWTPVGDGQFNYAAVGAMAIHEKNPDINVRWSWRTADATERLLRRRNLQNGRRRRDLGTYRPFGFTPHLPCEDPS